MRGGKGRRLCDEWMVQESLVDLARRYLFPASVDQLFETSAQIQVAVLVQISLIAGSKPAFKECGGIGFRIVGVARGDVSAADNHLAGSVAFRRDGAVGQYCNFRTGRRPNRP